MTLDEIVSSDLAALGADSRRRLRSVDDSLRALHAARRSVHVAPPALLPLASGFAARMEQAAGGAAALACAIALLVVLHDARIAHPGPQPWWACVVEGNAATITAVIVAVVLEARGLAGALSGRWIEGRVRSAAASPTALADLGGRLARAGDAWAIGLSIAGTTCIALVLAVMTWTVGSDRWTVFFYDRPEAGALFIDRLRDLTIAVPSIIAGAFIIARASVRGARWPRALAHRSVELAAGAVAILTVHVAILCELRPFSWHDRFVDPASGLRSALTVIAALAVFVVATARAVRRRAPRYTADELAALSADDAALLPVAGAFRARIVRGVGGALAAAFAVGLLVVLHNPRGAIPNHAHLWWNASRWKFLVFDHHITIVALLLAAVLAARQAAAALADRAFQRRFRRRAPGGDAVAVTAAAEALAAARRLVTRLDIPAVALGIAGVSALVLVIGVLDLTVGADFWIFFQHHGTRVTGLLRHTLSELVVATTVSFVAAPVIARAVACRTDRAHWRAGLAHRATLAAGFALIAAATATWLSLDFGVDDVSAALADQPPVGLQNALMAAATLGVLLVAGGLAVRLRRGEQERAGLPVDA